MSFPAGDGTGRFAFVGDPGDSPRGIVYPRDVDIRTKLVFALAAVTLGSLLAFGWFLYGIADRMVGEGTAARLESLAESEADALASIVTGWQERVQLVASRTQLRISLRSYGQTADAAALGRIATILEDAAVSAPSVAALAVYGTGGGRLVAAGRAADAVPAELPATHLPARADAVGFLGLVPGSDGLPRVGYAAALVLDEEPVGSLYVLLDAPRLVALASDTTGLGRTGELMIVAPDPAGARTLHPVRHGLDGAEATGPVVLTGADDPALLALRGEEGVFTDGLRDYRGKAVWAATRALEVGDGRWGLVVKLDASETRASIRGFRDEMISLALALAGIGLLVAVLLGFRFAKPIHALSAVANRIREGDLSARADVKREDEIGFLARAFNGMADELQDRMTELHEYQKFFDVSLDMLCIAGTDGYFKRVNPAFTQGLGWSEEVLLGRPFLELVHPDDEAATQAEIDELATGRLTISFVNRFRCADGAWKRLKWNAYPEPETGRLYAVARETKDPVRT
ncbi:MAG: HAMP domain-containing protein [Gemmatimonadota bacterium]|nr:HAMP domain-containing protein [Gemmatimonadota bacterium]